MSEHRILFSPPDIGDEEIQEVVETLRSGWITTGERTKRFEKRISEYIGTNRTACLNSCTAGLELTLRLLDIGPGDEVITTAYTYTATAAVISHVGARIVLADTRKGSCELDYGSLPDLINEKTKAIIAVDIAGIIADYETLIRIVEEKKDLFRPSGDVQTALGRIAVIADSAHGFGASKYGRRSGNFADFTCFSFHAVKNLTTGEGGAVTWKSIDGISDDELYRRYMIFSLHGQTKDALSKTKANGWEYDILIPGFKCNMTDIQAAIGLKQLERYDGLLEKRREIVNRYRDDLSGMPVKLIDHFTDVSSSSCHLMLVSIPGITLEKRNSVISSMAEKGVATNVHYKPLPMLKAYSDLGLEIKDYPNAYDYYQHEITLPLHTLLSDSDVDYVCESFMGSLKEISYV